MCLVDTVRYFMLNSYWLTSDIMSDGMTQEERSSDPSSIRFV